MSNELLSTREAACRLGISVQSLYSWLAQSDRGTFVIRGQSTTIDYFQGGRAGQGRIKINLREVERLLTLMRVTPQASMTRQKPTKKRAMQHITANLGRPDD